jgi:hypothetical protein
MYSKLLLHPLLLLIRNNPLFLKCFTVANRCFYGLFTVFKMYIKNHLDREKMKNQSSLYYLIIHIHIVQYLYVYCYIVIASYFLTVATFAATYTLQQLGRSLQKNEKLVTVCLARSNFAPIHLPRRNTPAYGTHHLCVAILTTKHILTLPLDVLHILILLILNIVPFD